jgi:hypothetical protein
MFGIQMFELGKGGPAHGLPVTFLICDYISIFCLSGFCPGTKLIKSWPNLYGEIS